MKKYTLLLAVCAAIFYSSAAESRICFLADTDCQVGKFEDKFQNIKCDKSKYTFEYNRCKYLDYDVKCNDAKGNWYVPTGCVDGYVDMTDANVKAKYTCEGSLLCSRCCPIDKLRCRGDKYKICSDNAKPYKDGPEDTRCREPGSDKIIGTDDDVIKYEICLCDINFGFTESQCSGTGLKRAGDKCEGDNGTFYKQCVCNTAKGYTKIQKTEMSCPASCPQDCKSWEYIDIPDENGHATGYSCWTGTECNPKETPDPEIQYETCPIKYQSNFDQFWAGYDVKGDCKNITKDCTSLGYVTGRAETGIKCKDNTEPYRCLFDHEVVYCKSGLCTYPRESDCKTKNANSNCTKNAGDICFMPTSCKEGKHKPCNGGTLTDKDEFGCGTCTCPENMIIVDNNCVSAFESCADAGYSDVSDSCKGTTTILLRNGSNKTCCNGGFCSGTAKTSCSAGYFVKSCTSYNNTEYGTCDDVYANCEAAGFYATEADCGAGYNCTTTNIYTSTSGTKTTCYKRGFKKLCPVGYATSESGCLQTPDGLTCDNGYNLFLQFGGNYTYYSGDTGCGECTCKRDLDPIDPKPDTGCLCTDPAKPYEYNGGCYAECPLGNNNKCIMCKVVDQPVIDDGVQQESHCTGGSKTTKCSCGYYHYLGEGNDHFCVGGNGMGGLRTY